MRIRILIPLCFLSIITACGSAESSTGNEVRFTINSTPVEFNVPDGYSLIKDPVRLRQYSYPENQELYYVLVPNGGPGGRYIAIGSNPSLDAHNITTAMFNSIKKPLVEEFRAKGLLTEETGKLKPMVNEWRRRKGLSDVSSVQMIGASVFPEAYTITGVVSAQDGSESVSCTRMQHYKNRVIVIGISTPLDGEEDIEWAASTGKSIGEIFKK